MNLNIFILFVFLTNFTQSLGSRVRQLDQVYLDDDNKDVHSMPAASKNSANTDVVKSSGSCNSDNKNQMYIQSYIKRYINTFMRNTDLKNVDTSDMGIEEFVHATLNIRLKAGHLEELKKFYYEEKPISLPDLDTYLSHMFYNSHVEEFEGYFYKVMKVPVVIFLFFYEIINITIFSYVSASLLFFYAWYKQGLKTAILILLVVLAAIDSVQKYFFALKKAEIEQFLRLKKLKHVSPTCDPSTYTYYRTFRNFFWDDECQQLLEDMEISHIAHVSFNQCVLETFLHLYFEIPLSCIANSVSVVVSAMAVNSTTAWILKPVLSLIIFFILLGAVLILLGANLNFGNWLFGRLSIGFRKGNLFTNLLPDPAVEENERRNPNIEQAPSIQNLYLNVTVPMTHPNGSTVTHVNSSEALTFQPSTSAVQHDLGNTSLVYNDPRQTENQRSNKDNTIKCNCDCKYRNELSVNEQKTKNYNTSQADISNEPDTDEKSSNNIDESNENNELEMINDLIDGMINKLNVTEVNDQKNAKIDLEEVDLKYHGINKSNSSLSVNGSKNVEESSIAHLNLNKNKNFDVKAVESNVEIPNEKIELGTSHEEIENSNKHNEKSGTSYEIVVTSEKFESLDEESSEAEILETDEDINSSIEAISNTSSDLSELDLGAEVASIKIGLRSLIEEDFVNVQ